ncbi:MAG: hypothetical protein ACT4O1_01570 [Gemmatimonadota bacterium]
MIRIRHCIPLLVALAALRPAPAQAQRLDDIVEIIAFAWSHGDVRTVVAMAAREGIQIETKGERMGPLGTRQAQAVLRRIFGDRETVSIEPGMVQMVGGKPRRAFGEITWVTRAPDTTESERLTVFLELVYEGERWRLTQIRMLP